MKTAYSSGVSPSCFMVALVVANDNGDNLQNNITQVYLQGIKPTKHSLFMDRYSSVTLEFNFTGRCKGKMSFIVEEL